MLGKIKTSTYVKIDIKDSVSNENPEMSKKKRFICMQVNINKLEKVIYLVT